MTSPKSSTGTRAKPAAAAVACCSLPTPPAHAARVHTLTTPNAEQAERAVERKKIRASPPPSKRVPRVREPGLARDIQASDGARGASRGPMTESRWDDVYNHLADPGLRPGTQPSGHTLSSESAIARAARAPSFLLWLSIILASFLARFLSSVGRLLLLLPRGASFGDTRR